MKQDYWEIPSENLPTVQQKAWSIENMKAHGAAGRNCSYIGSARKGALDGDYRNGTLIHDYFRDKTGQYWFSARALLPNGDLVSINKYLFGHKVEKTGGKRKWS